MPHKDRSKGRYYIDSLIGSSSISFINELENRVNSFTRGIKKINQVLWEPKKANKPQQEAYVSPADRLFYGGAAGGG